MLPSRWNRERRHEMKLKKASVTMSGIALLVASAWAAWHHLPIHAATIDNPVPASSHHHRHKELWVTRQRDSAISILKFPDGALLSEFSLPSGTQPHITTFHSGAFAYIAGMGNGTLSIVDANSRQLVQTLTFAPALCHQGKVSPDGTTMLVSVVSTGMLHKVAVDEASAGGGHIYTLDMTNDMLRDRGTLGAASWHSLNITRDETLGFGTSPLSDEVVAIDLTTQPVTKLGTIPLQPLPGTGNDQPDAMGGGEVIVDGTLPVSLRAAGQVALVDADDLEIERFIGITSPSPPGTFSTMTCIGCSVHGVTVRPVLDE